MTGDRALELLGMFRGKTVAVIGDYILDEYIVGDSGRVSREAPVVVVNYRRSLYHPGGAANASRNVVSLGGRAIAVGVTGEDSEARILANLLKSQGVEVDGLLALSDFQTALKMRIMAGDLHAQKQQVARVDRIFEVNQDNPVFSELEELTRKAVDRCNAVLLSDYGMGIVPGPLSQLAISAGNSKGIPVIVDSRFRLLEYRGAAVATPNEVEAIEALDLKSRDSLPVEDVARKLVAKADIASVIITRGNLGMYAYHRDGEGCSIGILGTNEATDVTGAGDTVASAVALAMASGSSIAESAAMATCAAAVVVMKRGTAYASPEEIEALIKKYPSF